MNRSYFLSTIFFFFILGFFLLLYLLFQNAATSFTFSDEANELSVYDFSLHLNNANNFYKRQQYEMAVKTLDQVSYRSLKNKQKYSVSMLKASCYKAMGLYNTSLDQIKVALSHVKHPFAYYLQGLIYEKQNKIPEAIEVYLKCIKLDPFHYYAYERLGDIYFRKSYYKKAAEYYDGGGAIKSYLTEALHLKRVLSFYLMGDSKTSLSLLDKYFELSKVKRYLSLAYFLKAIVGELSLDESIVRENFLKAIEIAKKKEIDLVEYYYAFYLIKQGDYEEATRILTSRLELYEEGDKRIYFTLGQVYYLQKKYKSSQKYFSLNFALGNKGRQDIYYLAVTSYQLRNYQLALKYFSQLLKDEVRDEYSLSAYICLAYSYTRIGQPMEAIRLFNAAFEEFGVNKPLVLSLADIVLEQMPEQFSKLMSKHLKSGDFPELNIMLAGFLLAEGSYLEYNKRNYALGLLMEYIQKSPPTTDILKICGDINLHQRNMQKAKGYYQQALRLVSNEEQKIQILNNLSYYYFFKNDLQQSRKMLNSALAIKLDPAINLNLYLLHRDDDSTAKEFLFSAANEVNKIKEDKLKASIYFELGLWYADENLEKTKNYFEKVLQFNPKHQLVQYYLNKI